MCVLESAIPVPHPRSVAALGLLLIALKIEEERKMEKGKESEMTIERKDDEEK
jgi:hypothetical protein